MWRGQRAVVDALRMPGNIEAAMNDEEQIEPGSLKRLWWFVWAGWNRVVCATRGHVDDDGFCSRCGLPLWERP